MFHPPMRAAPCPPRRAAALGIALLAGAALLLAIPAQAAAQDGFLFRRPTAGMTLRAGPMIHTANGDLLAQLRRDLTLARRDLATPVLAADLVISPLDRLDVVLSIGHATVTHGSEFRDWVDLDDLPIQQTTRLRTTPLTVGLRYHLLSRGRPVGRTAWVPATTTPYIGAGAGMTWYRLDHHGEFIDFRDFSIFRDYMTDEGSTRVAHAMAGVDHWFTPRIGLNAEARYTYGRANPESAFRSFDALDVGGAQATLGLSFRW
jgi:hypothetical protein